MNSDPHSSSKNALNASRNADASQSSDEEIDTASLDELFTSLITLEILDQKVSDPTFLTNISVLDAIIPLGPQAVPALRELLQHENPYFVERACEGLRELGPAASGAVDDLVSVLWRYPNLSTYWLITSTLIRLGPAATSAVPSLIGYLQKNPHSDEIVDVLGSIGSGAADSIPLLINILAGQKQSEDLIASAVEAIEKIGYEALLRYSPAVVHAIPHILNQMFAETPDSWISAYDGIILICRVAVEEAVSCLLPIANGTSEQAADATSILEELGPVVVPILLHQVQSATEHTAVRIIEGIGDPAIPALVTAATSDLPFSPLAMRLLRSMDTDDNECSERDRPSRQASDHGTDILLSEEDQQLLSWFSNVNITKYRTSLQLFWCFGRLDGEAMISAGDAMSIRKLASSLRSIRPRFQMAKLPISGTNLFDTHFRNLEDLFKSPPFPYEAWADNERDLEVRSWFSFPNKKRGKSIWTKKAWKAWLYVDRYLKLKAMLPTIVSNSLVDRHIVHLKSEL